MMVRSPALAEFLVRHLNGERPQVAEGDRSRSPRYTVGHTQRHGEWFVSSDASAARAPSMFGDGFIARTPDHQLAETAARILNDVDPKLRPRVTRAGWW